MKTFPAFITALALGAAGTAQAATVTVTTSNVGAANTTALATAATTGADMDGMLVTARFGTSTETVAWGSTGGTTGGPPERAGALRCPATVSTCRSRSVTPQPDS